MKKQKLFNNEIFGVSRLVFQLTPEQPASTPGSSGDQSKPLSDVLKDALSSASNTFETATKYLDKVKDKAPVLTTAAQVAALTAAPLLTTAVTTAALVAKTDKLQIAPAATLQTEPAAVPAEKPEPAAETQRSTPEAATDKINVQQKCEIMKKYVGEGADKKISFANFKALLEKHGDLPIDSGFANMDNLSDNLAGKVVTAVTKLQEKAAPISTDKLLRDGIFGNKTFQACVAANLINSDGMLAAEEKKEEPKKEEPAKAAAQTPPEVVANANGIANAMDSASLAPAPAPEAPKEQIPTFDHGNYEKFYAIKYEISDDATRKIFEGRGGEVVYIRDPQKDIEGDNAKVELSSGQIVNIPKGILSNLKGVTGSDAEKITAYMAKRYEKIAGDLGIKRDDIKILDGKAVLTIPHGNNPAAVDAQPSTGQRQKNVALAKFSDTSATEAEKNQYIIERCEAEATLKNNASA